jgi:hypothetical protein
VVIISAENKPAQNNFYLTEPFDITVWAGIVSNTDGKVLFHLGWWRVSGVSMSRETPDSGRKNEFPKTKFWILKSNIGCARPVFVDFD